MCNMECDCKTWVTVDPSLPATKAEAPLSVQ